MSELKDVFFISMEGQQNFEINGLKIRDDIMLPVYIPEGETLTNDKITPDNIMTGMIKVITAEPDNQDIEYYRQFIYAVDPQIEARLSSIAYEAENTKHFPEAFDMFKTLISLNPDSLTTNLNLAVSYDEYSQYLSANGQDDEAEKYEELAYEMYKVVEEFDNKDESSFFYLGRFYLLRENYEKAIEYFKEFVKISNDQERIQEVKQLLIDMDKLGVKDPDYEMGVSLIHCEKYQDAIEVFDQYIKNYPKSWNGYYMKAIAQRYLGDNQEAIKNLEKSLTFNEKSSDIYNEIGLNYMNLKEFSKSELAFTRALRYNPDDTAIMGNLAKMSYKRGNIEEAKKYCQVILELFPDDLHTKDLLKAFEEGNV